MNQERFEQFTVLISGIYRDIQKLKTQYTESLGIKNVHIFWVYLLFNHPEGLTASELAEKSLINRSLVSREINNLVQKGYIATAAQSGHRRYGWKFVLTDSGRKVAEKISNIAINVQKKVDEGISEADLEVFYSTLTALFNNFETLV